MPLNSFYFPKFSGFSGFSGGFKLNDINSTGTTAIIGSCINCCENECPQVDDVNADVPIVTKVFRSLPSNGASYRKEIAYGNLLRGHDPNQYRFVYSLPKTCDRCQDVTLGSLPERVQRILRRANFAADENTLLSSFFMYNTIALDPYENISRIPELRKDFLRESVRLLHTWGICHNDLHKFNILRGSDGNPRIIDFGAASSFDPNNILPGDSDLISNDLRMLETALRIAPPELPRGRRSGGGGRGGGGGEGRRSRSRSPRARSRSRSPRARSRSPRARSRSPIAAR